MRKRRPAQKNPGSLAGLVVGLLLVLGHAARLSATTAPPAASLSR